MTSDPRDEQARDAFRRTVSRRQMITGVGGLCFLAGTGGGIWAARPQDAQLALLSRSVAFVSPHRRVLLLSPDRDALVPGTRVLAETRTSGQIAQARSWLAAAPAWTRAQDVGDLARSALLDLQVLSQGLPAPVAGWSERWRYVWPRDASMVAVALAVAGQGTLAQQAMAYLQRVQRPDGWFEARYVPGTRRAPDDRERQLDGTGWALWAAERLRRELPSGDDFARGVRPMVVRSTQRILASIDTRSGLPAPCPDYWEVSEDTTTLGTCAALASGLEAATRLLGAVDEPGLARRAAVGLERFTATIQREFGRYGYPRHPRGHDPDAAIAFLLPPFREDPPSDALAALQASVPRMTREAGGLAPGTSWRQDGVSWTPETALCALASAAGGDPDAGRHWLSWLADHRTTAGSFPEKVLADGQPASVAPLTWTAALVLLTLHQLTSLET